MLSNTKRDLTLFSILYIIMGTLFLAYPESSQQIVCYICSGVLCVLGLFHVINYIHTPVTKSEYRPDLVCGILAISASVFVLMRPEWLIAALPITLAIVIIIDSIVKLQNTFDMLRL